MRRQKGAFGGNVAPRFAPIALGQAKHPGGWALALLTVIWAVAVGARLILIDQPFVDHWSWRQSDVAAIARNFFENGFHFAYPQIDWAGDSRGYVGTEFPILPFAAAICYKLTAVHEWIGRSQAVIFFAPSLPFFFLLARETFGSTAAVWAAFFFSFAPLNVFAGRSFMPDVPSLSLAIVGLYFFCAGAWMSERHGFIWLRLRFRSHFSSKLRASLSLRRCCIWRRPPRATIKMSALPKTAASAGGCNLFFSL